MKLDRHVKFSITLANKENKVKTLHSASACARKHKYLPGELFPPCILVEHLTEYRLKILGKSYVREQHEPKPPSYIYI